MSINAPASGGSFEPAPEGNFAARVYRIIHIGTVLEMYMGEEKEIDKIQIGFELPTELKVFKEGEPEQPISITQEYTLSMNEKANLKKIVVGIIGSSLSDDEAEAFDLTDLLGQECMLNIVHKKAKQSGNVYAKVQSTSPVPKGLKVPKAVNSAVLLDYEDWSQETFDKLSDWTKDKMRASVQYKEKFGEGVSEEEINPDDIPV